MVEPFFDAKYDKFTVKYDKKSFSYYLTQKYESDKIIIDERGDKNMTSKNSKNVDSFKFHGLKPIHTSKIVNWGNDMVEAIFSATEIEMKMLIALSAQLDKAGTTDYTLISAQELGKLMKLNPKNAYRDLRQITSKLFDRRIVFKTIERLANNKPKKEENFHIFSRLTYDNEHSAIGFKFSEAVEPLLAQVKSAYVQVPLKTTMTLKGQFTNRVLMKVIKWEKLSPYVVALDELRDQWQVGTKYKKNAEFIRSAITYSVKQINKFTKYQVEAIPIKTGRSITHIKFTITQKKENEPIETEASEVKLKKATYPKAWSDEQKAMYDELLGYGLTKKAAKEFVSTKLLQDIRISVDYTLDQQKAGKVDKLSRYLYTAIANDYNVADARDAAAKKAEKAEKTAQELEEQKQKLAQEADEKAAIQAEKDTIKAEFLQLEKAEQERYIDTSKSELSKMGFARQAQFKNLLQHDFSEIVSNDAYLKSLIDYIYHSRHLMFNI